MIDYYKRTVKNIRLRKIDNFERGCWINVVDPSETEIEYLYKTFDLDKRNLISGLDRNEVPRVEFDNGIVYIVLKIISPEGKKDLHTFLIIIGETFILTFSKYKLSFIGKILEGHVEFITTQKLKCLIKLLSMVNKDFERATHDVVRLVNSKKESFNKLTEKDINILLEQESILNNFVSAYHYTNLVYERVMKKIRFFEEDKEILEDLIIEAKQGFELCNSSLTTISNIRNHFEVLLSNKLTKVITLLTIFTILISVPAAISGIYGMNIALPLQKNPLSFYYISLLIVFIWIVFILYLKKRRIL